jgi:CBS domain-containing protein
MVVAVEAKIKSIMIEIVHATSGEATAVEAASVMLEKGVSCLIVTGKEGPIGMITERDILRRVTAARLNAGRVRVKDIMSTPLIATSMDSSIGDAARKMIENNIKRLVVLGQDGTFLGLVTMTDLVRWLAKEKELSDALIDYLKYHVP